jgi:hypothetical protein
MSGERRLVRRRSRGPCRCYGRRPWPFPSHARDPALEDSQFQTPRRTCMTQHPPHYEQKSHEGGLDARALSWPLHFVTGRRACTLTRDSFSAIALGPRFYARTSPLAIPAFLFFRSGPLRCLLVYTQHCLRSSGPLPSQNMSPPRIIFAPPVVGRETVQCAFTAGPGQAVEARNIVSPYMPCQSVACRRHVSLGTFLYFYHSTTPAYFMPGSTFSEGVNTQKPSGRLMQQCRNVSEVAEPHAFIRPHSLTFERRRL